MKILRLANFALFILFPIAWFAPLLRAGLLPFFALDEISIMTALQSLWGKDIFLAVVVTIFAIFSPLIKVGGTALIQYGLLSENVSPALEVLGKFAMADVFLVALYIIFAQGVGIGRVETAWGLYLFTFCVLVSLTVTHLSKKANQ